MQSDVTRRNVLKTSVAGLSLPAISGLSFNVAAAPDEYRKTGVNFLEFRLDSDEYPANAIFEEECRRLPTYQPHNDIVLISRGAALPADSDTLVGTYGDIKVINNQSEVSFPGTPVSVGRSGTRAIKSNDGHPIIGVDPSDDGFKLTFGQETTHLTKDSHRTLSQTVPIRYQTKVGDTAKRTIEFHLDATFTSISEALVDPERYLLPATEETSKFIESMIGTEMATEAQIDVFRELGVIALNPAALGGRSPIGADHR